MIEAIIYIWIGLGLIMFGTVLERGGQRTFIDHAFAFTMSVILGAPFLIWGVYHEVKQLWK